MNKWRVRWQFNRKFQIKRSFATRADARQYARRVKRLWNIDARAVRVA